MSPLTDDDRLATIREIIGAVSDLRSIYFFACPKDTELVKSAYLIKNAVFLYLYNGVDTMDEQVQERIRFSRLFDVYVSIDWRRIKLETVGKGEMNKKLSTQLEKDILKE